MPAAKPEEFRRKAVELARLGEMLVAQIVKELGISESGLRRWMGQTEVEAGTREGLTREEREQLVRLRRRTGRRRWISRSSSARRRTSLRLREAGLLGSMGKVASAYYTALMESFFGSVQIELLDGRCRPTRASLATAMFEWIEAFYNPRRRHSSLNYLSLIDYENRDTATPTAA